VRIIVSYSSIEFARDLGCFEMSDLLGQAVGKVSILLSKGRRRSRLSMRVCKHGIMSPVLALSHQNLKKIVHGRDNTRFK